MDPGRSEQTKPPEESPDQHAHATEPESPGSVSDALSTLPESYGETTLVAVPVDPYVVHCQWEVAPADLERAKQTLGVSEQEFWPVLRFYDVTNAAPDESAPDAAFDVDVQLQAGNWYVRSCGPDRSYRADLALKREDGSLVVVASSNPAHTPPSTLSTHADEHWLPIRLDPRQAERAAPVGPPLEFPVDPSSSAQSDTAPPSRLPIDMSEEVRSKLAALYGEQEPEPPESPLQGRRSMPVDMQEEVKSILTKLYEGPRWKIPALARHPCFIQELSFERVLQESAASLEMKPSALADLTELNERSFASGISSRTK